MIEFITAHIETFACIVTILGGTAAMFKFMMSSIRKEFVPMFNSLENKMDRLENRMEKLEGEQFKFHTRLTFLDGYITGHDPKLEKRDAR